MAERSFQFFDRINIARSLPSLPQILLKLIELCNSEESEIKDISQIINKDASLSAKILNMANSAHSGLSKRAANIDQALTILGKNAIKNIAISDSDIQTCSKVKDNSVFGLKDFWRHSLMCAVLSKLIAKKISYPAPDEAFLAGLLHDLGKLVLWVNFPREYADNLKSSQYQRDLILAAEARYGATHGEVGAWLIRNWDLQSFMADAVLYHHDSLDRIIDALPLIKIIYVGNILCPETNKAKEVKFDIAEKIFGFEAHEVEKIILQAEKEVIDTAQTLGINIEPLDDSGREVSEKDYKKQEDLINEIKDIALLQGTLQNLLEAQDEDSILKVVQQSIDILFDVKQVSFFLYEPERNVLLGKSVSSDKKDDLISALSMSVNNGKSLLVKSLLQETPLDSFGDSIKDRQIIIDEQIIRFVGADGIMCLPMAAHKQYIGVIVLGLKEVCFSNLSQKTRLLMMFTKQAALALHANYLRQSRAKVVQPEHLSATATRARQVIHEVNTPLSIIKNYLAVFRSKLPEKESLQEAIRIINEEIDRVALIIHDLSDFSKPKIQPRDSLDLNVLLSDQIKILQESVMLQPNINAHLKLDQSLPKIMTDKNRIKQVFSNLINNAAEAMPGGGNLNISTRYVANHFDANKNQIADSEQGYVEIAVKDDGPGIPESIKAQLFEPYVTSKTDGHNGLGLSIVNNIVKELRGIITCDSDNKKGTSFKIVFPITQNQ